LDLMPSSCQRGKWSKMASQNINLVAKSRRWIKDTSRGTAARGRSHALNRCTVPPSTTLFCWGPFSTSVNSDCDGDVFYFLQKNAAMTGSGKQRVDRLQALLRSHLALPDSLQLRLHPPFVRGRQRSAPADAVHTWPCLARGPVCRVSVASPRLPKVSPTRIRAVVALPRILAI
jgi:hypothetical protein